MSESALEKREKKANVGRDYESERAKARETTQRERKRRKNDISEGRGGKGGQREEATWIPS